MRKVMSPSVSGKQTLVQTLGSQEASCFMLGKVLSENYCTKTVGDVGRGNWDKGGSRGTKIARKYVWKLLFQ